MSKYPSTNIVYSGIEDKGGPTVTIIDEKKNKWTIWKKDYDNKQEDSEAYSSLKSYQIGKSFGVEYGEKQDSFVKKDGPDAGKTINFTRRTIYKILPLVANPIAVPSGTRNQPQSSNTGQNRASQGSSSDAFGRRLALYGMVNGMLAAGATVEIIVKDLPALMRLEDTIERTLNETRPVKPFDQDDDLPVIQQDDGVDVERIPF